jgi:BTB/POZ domain
MADAAVHDIYYFHDQTVGSAVLNALLRQKQNDGMFCDVTLRVCGREIRAHSSILASVSPYFAAFFSSDLPRSYSQRSPQLIEIMVDDNGPEISVDLGDAVNAVVDFIYSGSLQIDPSNVAHIAEIGEDVLI